MVGALAGIALAAAWSPAAIAHPELVAQIELMGEHIVAEPNNPQWRIKRGDLNRRHQDYVAAESDFQAARELDPNNVELNFYQGRLALDAGDAALAEQWLGRYLGTNTQHSAAWRLRGEANMRLDQPLAAAGYFENAISAAESPSPALYQQQIQSLRAGGDEYNDKALAVVDEGLARFGAEVSLLGLGVDIALASGQQERARDYLAQLPEGLEKLPAWQSRIQAAQKQVRQSE